MIRLLVLLFAIALVGLAAGVAFMVAGDAPPVVAPILSQVLNPTEPVDPTNPTVEVFTVNAGDSAADIGQALQQRGLIRSGLGFRMVAEQEGVAGSLTAGDYELSRAMSTAEVVRVLARGQVKRGLIVTIPEGWRAEQIADRLEAVGFASGDEFLRAVADPRGVPEAQGFDPLPPTLEGYLFPQTYEVREKVSGAAAAGMMIRMFEQRAGALSRQGAGRLTVHQVLTLASIVEREAQRPEERPTIASVYLNRLKIDMPLQADPTVQYAVADADGPQAAAYGYWKRDLTLADLQIASPFNTYQRSGLPPGPICNPGESSIRAVLEPAETDYLYFVATGDGRHLFARTLAEHNANIQRVSSGT